MRDQPAALCDATLSSLPLSHPDLAVPAYERDALTPGIAHIGVGNFHRVHQAAYIDRCLHLPGHAGWAISGIGLGDGAGARAKAEAFRQQDGLYAVTQFAADGSSTTRVIGAMVEYLHAPGDPQAVLARLAHPATRIVSLTITEGGYNIDESSGDFMLDTPDVASDLAGHAPRTAFGYIVEALRQRRAAGLPAFTVLSCDNLRQNGDTARHAVLSFARAHDGALADWIAHHVEFPNSMVDRIAPGVSADDRQRLASLTGVHDRQPAIGEPYMQWVLEDRFSNGRPDLAAAGVELRSDVHAYEAMKGRLLNAAHMLLAYPAILLGYRLVAEAMADPLLHQLLNRFMESDVIPHLDGPQGVSLYRYKDKVLERFANPAVADQLLRVAHDGAAKIPVFHAQTMDRLLGTGGNLERMAFLLACYASYLGGNDEQGQPFEVKEPRLDAADLALLAGTDPLALLHTSPFRGMALADDAALCGTYLAMVNAIDGQGVRATLRMML